MTLSPSAYGPKQLTLEPPQAQEVVVNLIRQRRRFAVELDAAIAKDVVCVAIGGQLGEREHEEYARNIVLRTFDDAAQFAVNCIQEELCFDCKCTAYPDKRVEWAFTIERNKRHRARREARF